MDGMEHDAADVDVSEKNAKKQATEHGHGHSHEHSEEAAKIVALGTVTVGGATFMVDRDGQVEAGGVTEFGVELVGAPGVVPSKGWLANPDGTQVCEPVSGEGHGTHWHFNVEPLEPVKKSKFVLQAGGEEASIDWARGQAPGNGGILSVFKGDAKPLYLELKMHGDAGDLELWLTRDTAGGKPKASKPFDVPKETVVRIAFPSHPGKSVELRVRDGEQNKDEDGTPNMRPEGTNYFIFPGETGADPAWLVGETPTSWRGVATVSFEVDGKPYASDPFVLVPHDALEPQS